MIDSPAQRESFIVRIWQEKGQSEWQGWVQHICSGDKRLISFQLKQDAEVRSEAEGPSR